MVDFSFTLIGHKNFDKGHFTFPTPFEVFFFFPFSIFRVKHRYKKMGRKYDDLCWLISRQTDMCCVVRVLHVLKPFMAALPEIESPVRKVCERQ